tara:strand:+ start:439 stop:816 length:378 start_codon:yes stop_codon:yes gene_type:complete
MCDKFKEAFLCLSADVLTAVHMENALAGKGPLKTLKSRGNKKNKVTERVVVPKDPVTLTKQVLDACKTCRKRGVDTLDRDISDQALNKVARFTDKFNLKPYEPFLHYVPRLVNVVTVDTPLTSFP